jgi:hypothetical protein
MVFFALLGSFFQGLLAEELQNVAKDLPSREEQLKVAKKRTREQRVAKKEHKRKPAEKPHKEKRHRRSISDTELEALEPTTVQKAAGGTPGRRQLNRLLSTSKKLLPRFASDHHDERSTTTPNSETATRKFLKARRKASSSSTDLG